jgi:hypothetical protein
VRPDDPIHEIGRVYVDTIYLLELLHLCLSARTEVEGAGAAGWELIGRRREVKIQNCMQQSDILAIHGTPHRPLH